MIIIPDFSKTVNPGHNFYQYINEKWLKNAPIPDYRSSYSVNEEIMENIEKDLYTIIDSSSLLANKGERATTTYTKLKDIIGRFYLSSMRKGVQKNSISTLKQGIIDLNCIRSVEDIGETLGYFCRNHIDTILSTYLQIERTKHNESIYILFISYGNLGLPDISYYNATAPGKLHTLSSYIELIKKVCKYLEIDDISDIITLESFFAAHIDGVSNDETITYTGEELIKKYKRFPWKVFFESYGIAEWKTVRFRIKSSKFFHILEKAFETIPYTEWKRFFTLQLILHAMPILPPPYDDIDFKFFDNILRGQKKKVPQRTLTLNLIKNYLTQPLSILYKKYYLKDSLKKNATVFIEKIRDSAIDQIASNSWMLDATKKEAREKVKNMVLSIGWPEKYPTIVLPELQTDDLLTNVYLLSAASTDEDNALLNKKSKPGTYWSEPTFLVNDFYYNEINEFIIPAASLFYPFFDTNIKKIGWNYGGIGAVIGHEMIHAFDEDGRNYNEHGLYKPWWKARDTRRFHTLTKELIDFYSNSKIQGKNINGTLTLNENLADLGGLSIALEALKKDLKGQSEEKRIHELREFFISYAISWRTKQQPKKELQSLILDRHSPPELRVNNIVCHFDEWYEAFNINVGAKMYIAPEDRITIF